MTTNATTAEDRFAKLGIHLPGAPTPFGASSPLATQNEGSLRIKMRLSTWYKKSGRSVFRSFTGWKPGRSRRNRRVL